MPHHIAGGISVRPSAREASSSFIKLHQIAGGISVRPSVSVCRGVYLPGPGASDCAFLMNRLRDRSRGVNQSVSPSGSRGRKQGRPSAGHARHQRSTHMGHKALTPSVPRDSARIPPNSPRPPPAPRAWSLLHARGTLLGEKSLPRTKIAGTHGAVVSSLLSRNPDPETQAATLTLPPPVRRGGGLTGRLS